MVILDGIMREKTLERSELKQRRDYEEDSCKNPVGKHSGGGYSWGSPEAGTSSTCFRIRQNHNMSRGERPQGRVVEVQIEGLGRGHITRLHKSE